MSDHLTPRGWGVGRERSN